MQAPPSLATAAAAGPEHERRHGGVPGTGCKPKRLRKKNDGRVTWDEQVIAEHDKERGTRQKIDEPDTPFVRSPNSASESEAELRSSDDEHRRPSIRLEPASGVGAAQPPLPLPLDSAQPGAAGAHVDAETLANRLDSWVRSGKGDRSLRRESGASSDRSGFEDQAYAADGEGSQTSSACSSRASSSAPHSHRTPLDGSTPDGGPRKAGERRISLPEESTLPKPTSANFKAMRAQHYNEIAAMKAFRGRGAGEDSPPESDTSAEEEQTETTTNTNTNVNATIAKVTDTRPGAGSFSEVESGAETGSRSLSKELNHDTCVAFRDGGDKHGDSLDGGLASTEVNMQPVAPLPNSVDWLAKRQAHYNEMAAALRSMPPPSDDEDEEDGD